MLNALAPVFWLRRIIVLLVGIIAVWAGARAAEPSAADCRALAEVAEQEAGLPHGLLFAIGQVETGRPNPATGRIEPWPWSTNSAGVGHYFASAEEAIAWTEAQQRSGQPSIDVGCFQINLKYHPDAFASLEEAFDPAHNARYAASFLASLYARVGSWQLAAAQYHSADPTLGELYGSRVFALLGGGGMVAGPALQAAFTTRAGPSAIRLGGIRMPVTAFGIQVIVPSWAMAQIAQASPAAAAHGAAKVQMVAFHASDRRLPRVFTPS